MKLRAVIGVSLTVMVAGCAAQRSYRAPPSANAPQGEAGSTVTAQSTPSVASVEEDADYPSAAPPPAAGPRWQTPAPATPAMRPPAPVITSVQPAPTPTAPASVDVGPRVQPDDERAVREGRIGAQVQRIRDEQIRLAANPGVCHDVCFAAGSICLAAQEVCRLAGDGDPRCGRARTACTDAGRQRDGSCPACPPAH